VSNADTDFLHTVLDKIARRYSKRGRLSGRMKLGTALDHATLARLHQYFGVAPLRINNKEETHLDFDRLLNEATQAQWLNRIGKRLGRPVQVAQSRAIEQETSVIISRLKLAFPQLSMITDRLDDPKSCTHALFFSLLKQKNAQTLTDLAFQTAQAVVFLLSNHDPITISELGARFFENSKALRQGEARQLLIDWLACCYGLGQEEDAHIWSHVHVYHDRLTVNAVIYGPIVYKKNGMRFDWIARLYQQGEPATLSWSNLQGIEEMGWTEATVTPRLISCENEAPFSRLIREKGTDCVLFTSGFPNSAVHKLYALLAPRARDSLHWGDTDPNGLYIASLLCAIHPLSLYRCDLATIKRHPDHLLPLTARQRERAQTILNTIEAFPFPDELACTLTSGWMEQEIWQPE